MRVLFLDCDGVLHWVARETEPVLPFGWLTALAALLTPRPDVRVAVHSTWRYDHTGEELRELLGPLSTRFVAAVPRGLRAKASRRFRHANPAINSHSMLDDTAAEAPAEFDGQVVICDPSLGISDARVRAAVAAWLAGDAR